MQNSGRCWYLLGTSTNKHDVTHFCITCGAANSGDFDELLQVLRGRFGAVDDGELIGPYSIHRYLKVEGLRVGIVLDVLEWLDLYATEASQKEAMSLFVTKLLEALNSGQLRQARAMGIAW